MSRPADTAGPGRAPTGGQDPRVAGLGEDVFEVELTADGYLRMGAELATRHFGGDALVAVPRDSELWVMPLHSTAGGGLLLKQRNLAGDRSALVLESLPRDFSSGRRSAFWDQANGVLRVSLVPDSGESRASRGRGRSDV